MIIFFAKIQQFPKDLLEVQINLCVSVIVTIFFFILSYCKYELLFRVKCKSYRLTFNPEQQLVGHGLLGVERGAGASYHCCCTRLLEY